MASLPSFSASALYHLFIFSFFIIFFFLLFMISIQTQTHIFGDHHSNAIYQQHEAALIMRKFPTLLSPSPAPTPSMSPLHHPHGHPHHHPALRAPIPKGELRRNDGGTRVNKMVVASLVSSGFIFILTILVIIIFVCYYKINKGKMSNLSSSSSTTKYSAELGTAAIKSNGTNWNIISSSSSNFQNTTTRKVSSHDDESPLEEQDQQRPHPFPLQTHSLKEDQESTSKDQLHPTNQDPILRSDSNIAAEIISIHNDSMESSYKYESDTAAHLKLEEDDDSFHSVCDSPHSSSTRLSNASAHSTTINVIEPTSHPPPPPPPPPPRLTPPSKALSSFKSSVSSNSEIKTHSTAAPPPPCPPGKLDQSRLPKLKPLHWDKLRAAPHCSTVWDKLGCSSFELDEEMIESLFGYHLKHPTKGDEPKGSSPNINNHVLEAKRLQNITILSKSVNATPHQVCHSLEKGEGLCLQQLEVLAKMTLTKEEEDKLSGYIGDVDELGSAEKFVKTMLKVPFAFQRIESMLYRETFDDEIIHLRKSLSMLQDACQELRSSRLFLKLLEAVLKTGNRMNDGTFRGGAKAFKLDALLKLADVKGTDGSKTTLLHFVVQEIIRSEGMRASESIMGKICQKNQLGKNAEEKEEDYRRMGLDLVSSLSVELHNVKKTATIDLDVVSSSMGNLFEGMCRVKNVVDEIEQLGNGSIDFVQLMRGFVSYADKNIKEIREEENEILWRVREITEYFHGDVNKDEANPLRIFVIVRDFLGMLDHVCRELRSCCSKIPNSPNPISPFR